jgi:hypothetical protein
MKMIYTFLNHIQKGSSNHPILNMAVQEDENEI